MVKVTFPLRDVFFHFCDRIKAHTYKHSHASAFFGLWQDDQGGGVRLGQGWKVIVCCTHAHTHTRTHTHPHTHTHTHAHARARLLLGKQKHNNVLLRLMAHASHQDEAVFPHTKTFFLLLLFFYYPSSPRERPSAIDSSSHTLKNVNFTTIGKNHILLQSWALHIDSLWLPL